MADYLEVYHFQGGNDEEVPETVVELIVDPGVRVLRSGLCRNHNALRKVTLLYGLMSIENMAFTVCANLLEVTICSTVQHIGARTFLGCERLTNVDFEFSTSSSPHQLETIGGSAFSFCTSLARIKLPSSVTALGNSVFSSCRALVNANLSTTSITEIPEAAFSFCFFLQTVSLPNTLVRICDRAFNACSELLTVVVPQDSKSIRIGHHSFEFCNCLAILRLPDNSTAKGDSFTGCTLLHEIYGEESTDIVSGLIGRFDDFPVHGICYEHSTITAQEARQCTAVQHEEESLEDEFGMTPFHILFSTAAEPISAELLDILLDSLPYSILNCQDWNERRPLEYLVANWTNANASLFQTTVQKWVIDPLARWGATSWMEAMQMRLQEILAENDEDLRESLCSNLYSYFEVYENVEATSILEMALWKGNIIKAGRTSDGSKRQALDRDECRWLSGADVVIPHVAVFLDIPPASSDDD